MGAEFNNQIGNTMQVDRGPSWMAGPPESSTMTLLPGPQPMVPGQMGPGNQPIRAPPVIFFDTEFHILLSANLSNGSIFFFINFFIYQRGSGLLVI